MFNQGFSPTLDKVFKKLFGHPGNEALTKSFINSTVGERYGKVREVVIIGTQFNPVPLNSPECFIDVLCMSEDEDLYILEMQKQLFTGFTQRCEAYAAATFIGQRIQDSLEKMKQIAPNAKCFETPEYKELKKVRSLILIEKQTYGPLAKEPYISHHTTRSEHTDQCIFNSISYTVVQLAKFHKEEQDITTDQDKWLSFMKKGPRSSESLYHTISDNNNIFTAAYNIIKASSFTEEEIKDLGLREKERLENVAMAEDARAEGRAAGMAAGRAEGREEGRAEGREEGRAEGMQMGREEGRAEGMQMGREIGLRDGKIEAAIAAFKYGLSIEKAADIAEMDVEEFKRIVESYDK